MSWAASELAETRISSPLVTIAIHRLLLAILHRVYKGPKNASDRATLHRTGAFDADRIQKYLMLWKERFDLFHEKFPFYQTASFKTKESSGINRLAQELSAATMRHSSTIQPMIRRRP